MQITFTEITLTNDDKVVKCHYYKAKESNLGAIFVGGIGGDFDSPANNLYPKLATQLCNEGISALRVQFRYPTNLEESVHDVLLGAQFLESQGINNLGLVGHSFGGAVVIQAGVKLDSVRTVVTLATQGHGAGVVGDLSPKASILLVHGGSDETLSPQNSIIVYDIAKEPKQILILKGNGHGLVESAEQVLEIVHSWLVKELKQPK